jgi:hypothetical protein
VGRRKSGDGGSEFGFGGLRFGPESPSPPLIRGGGGSSRERRWRREQGMGRRRQEQEKVAAASDLPRWPEVAAAWRCFFVSGGIGGRIRAQWCMGQQIWASWTGRIQPLSCFFSFLFSLFSLVLLDYIFYFYIPIFSIFIYY